MRCDYKGKECPWVKWMKENKLIKENDKSDTMLPCENCRYSNYRDWEKMVCKQCNKIMRKNTYVMMDENYKNIIGEMEEYVCKEHGKQYSESTITYDNQTIIIIKQ